MEDKDGKDAAQAFSVCVVLYKSEDVLDRMLDSLLPHLLGNDEVVFQNNYPKSGDKEIVATFTSKTVASVQYHESANNVGFAAACNQMAKIASNERLIFLNPDTITDNFERSSHLEGLVLGPLIYGMDGLRQCSSGRSRTVWDEFRMRWFRKFEYHNDQDELAYVSGAALSIEKDVFNDLGGFDDQFFMYYEDIDLCLRAKDAGEKIRIDNKWQIRHEGGSSARKIKLESELRSLESAFTFYKKWNQRWLIYRVLVTVDSLLRVLFYAIKGDFQSSNAHVQIIMTVIRRYAFSPKMN
jgi:GT2 family glycosyltransferase